MKIFLKSFFKKTTHERNPFPVGTVLFVGHQGAGKTLSAVHYIEQLRKRFPDLLVFSNIDVIGATKLKPQDITDTILKDYGRQPVVFFLDEIQVLLRTKSGNKERVLSEDTLNAISQQRKANKTIVGTLQEFLDLDISYRRQLRAQVQCRHVGDMQIEFWRDPNSLKYDAEKNDYAGKVMDIWIWKRHNFIYKLYDTYEIVRQSINTATRKDTPAQTG
jgi:SpoVK/Ycf46/Vps4 family AAA+-type ATPase